MTVLQKSGPTPRKGPASAMTLPLEGCGPSDLLPQSRFVALPAGVEQASGSVTHPRGFKAAGLHAGLKRSGNRDLGVLCSDTPCSSAVLFTTNAAAAAPVRLTRGSPSRACGPHCRARDRPASDVASRRRNLDHLLQRLEPRVRVRQLREHDLARWGP